MARNVLASAMLLLLTAYAAYAAYVPVYVMLPLNTVTSSGLTDPTTLGNNFDALVSAGTDGITVDVWWGLVESTAQTYDWSAYTQLFNLAKSKGLKIQIILDFHKCGGNVGDNCNIELPSWVLSVGNSNPDIWYTDSQGHRDNEYISLFVDEEPLFGGRTPVQIYSDFATSFANEFSSDMGTVIKQIEIGMGPAGEMRYPSYQLKYWNFCGVGEFQSYSSYALADLSKAASAAGHSDWGNAGGPNNAGTYSDYIAAGSTPFFVSGEPSNYASPYGQFFLGWYSSSLIKHGDRILSAMQNVFANSNNVPIVGKIAGIHWWYKTDSHAAELTAGYYNTNGNNAYTKIAAMFAKYGASFDFTCLEMQDSSQPADCDCGPQELVAQTKAAAMAHGVPFGGENALPVYGNPGYGQIEYSAGELNHAIDSFSYLRMDDTLLQPNNLASFKDFVSDMHSLTVFAADGSGASQPTHSEEQPRSNVKLAVGVTLGVVGFAAVLAVVVAVVRYRRRQSDVLVGAATNDIPMA